MRTVKTLIRLGGSDMSHRCARRSFCWLCRAAARIVKILICLNSIPVFTRSLFLFLLTKLKLHALMALPSG